MTDAERYRAWVADVQRNGGAVSVMPPKRFTDLSLRQENVPAAKYPASVWVPKVNAKDWPMPEAFDKSGVFGFYRAPAGVVSAAGGSALAQLNADESAALRASFWEQVRRNFATLGNVAKWAAIGAAVVVALVLLSRLGGQRA